MLLTLVLNVMSRIPFAALYWFADGVYLLNRHVIRYRYDVVGENLKNAFPDRSEQELDALREQVFRNLADLLVETVKGLNMSREELERRVSIEVADNVRDLVIAEKPAIYLSGHCGNWEWLLLYSCLHLPHPFAVAYQPFHDPHFDAFMVKARTRFGCQIIPSTDLVRQVIKARKSLKTLALLADQTPARNEKKFWIRFLNQETAFIDGTDSLAWLTGMSVVMARMRRKSRGHYAVSMEIIAEPPYQKDSHAIVERYARELEAAILAEPSGWLWSHRRWKLSRTLDEGDS